MAIRLGFSRGVIVTLDVDLDDFLFLSVSWKEIGSDWLEE